MEAQATVTCPGGAVASRSDGLLGSIRGLPVEEATKSSWWSTAKPPRPSACWSRRCSFARTGGCTSSLYAH